MSEPVDLLIIGGGVNGTGLARDAAGRGLKVTLVEQADLGSATSSASTKLIHGGLRYLEHYEFRLVREALAERERLLAIAPHIIEPMEFVLPHMAHLRPRWMIKLGLFLYDNLGGRKRLPGSRTIYLNEAPYKGTLNPALTTGFTYYDCRVDDSRLTLLNAVDAAELGATIHTRTRFVSARRVDGLWCVDCQHVGTGESLQVTAKVIVNVAGPWVGKVANAIAGNSSAHAVRLIKGSHVLVPKMYEGSHAYILQNQDGRVVFAIPYEQSYTMIGTTEVQVDSDAPVKASAEEIAYLCGAVSRYFSKTVTPDDVVWSFAGVRPLSEDHENNASRMSRDYQFELNMEPGPVLTVTGGKITTYRCLAEAALEKLAPVLGAMRGSWTAKRTLPGGAIPDGDVAGYITSVQRRWPFLSQAHAARLVRTYGTRAGLILGNAQTMAELGTNFGQDLTEAEINYLHVHEWAKTVDDVIWRRTKLGLHLTDAQVQAIAEQMNKLEMAGSGAQSLPWIRH